MFVFNPNDYKTVYSGKSGKCMCGCAGKYSEKGTRSFKVITTKMAKAEGYEIEYDFDCNGNITVAYVDDGQRIWAAYK